MHVKTSRNCFPFSLNDSEYLGRQQNSLSYQQIKKLSSSYRVIFYSKSKYVLLPTALIW